MAILDDDEGDVEFDELEDDFVSKANAALPEQEAEDIDDEGEENNMGSDFGDDDDQDNRSQQEETRSRFTEYSLSSSVIPRSEGLQQLDARFEKVIIIDIIFNLDYYFFISIFFCFRYLKNTTTATWAVWKATTTKMTTRIRK